MQGREKHAVTRNGHREKNFRNACNACNAGAEAGKRRSKSKTVSFIRERCVYLQ